MSPLARSDGAAAGRPDATLPSPSSATNIMKGARSGSRPAGSRSQPCRRRHARPSRPPRAPARTASAGASPIRTHAAARPNIGASMPARPRDPAPPRPSAAPRGRRCRTTLTKHASASPPTSASAATPTSDSRIGPADVTPPTQRPIHEPLADEAVQRRQAHDRDRADQERDPGERHAARETTEAVDVARARGVIGRARAEEQQALEQRVVQRVERARRRIPAPRRAAR